MSGSPHAARRTTELGVGAADVRPGRAIPALAQRSLVDSSKARGASLESGIAASFRNACRPTVQAHRLAPQLTRPTVVPQGQIWASSLQQPSEGSNCAGRCGQLMRDAGFLLPQAATRKSCVSPELPPPLLTAPPLHLLPLPSVLTPPDSRAGLRVP